MRVAVFGAAYTAVFIAQSSWPNYNAQLEQRYADALEAVRGALERMPDHAGLNYNYACFATLAGNTGDETFARLLDGVEAEPGVLQLRVDLGAGQPRRRGRRVPAGFTDGPCGYRRKIPGVDPQQFRCPGCGRRHDSPDESAGQ